MTGKEDKGWFYSNAATTFSDGVSLAQRKKDDIVLLQFVSNLPGHIIENFRTMMTKEDVKTFMDDLADLIEYFPVKKEPETKKKKIKAAPEQA